VSLRHLVLPAATLTFALIAHVSRMTRSSMLETLASNYVLYARAKGLPERVVLVRHALRNALLPTITVLAIDVGWLIGGIVVIETVFSYPGLGWYSYQAIINQDYFLLQGIFLFVIIGVLAANFLIDIVYVVTPNGLHAGHAIAAARAGTLARLR
jgi:peptide/nickel transport system permease protein